MKRKLLDGKKLAAVLQEDLKQRVARLVDKVGRPPGLGVILVGEDPASQTYVRNKERAAKRALFESSEIRLSSTTREEELLSVIDSLNHDSSVDGILLQLPLPHSLSPEQFIERIDPGKDADGLHPLNQGYLMVGRETVVPCTPRGVLTLIDMAYADLEPADLKGGVLGLAPVDLSGKHAVVIGRSILVGKPMGLLLLQRNATVTMAHSKTSNLTEICREADIVVAAVGVPQLVKGSWVKPGAVVIDVGINRLDDGTLCGDVDFQSAVEIAHRITPVPGGVGPMTVTMLLENTFDNYMRAAGISND